ncbi:hypothetical protein AB0D62_17520 [Streptomyces massasporeus]|uniref:hypothetical protein n=1 Tax=Streptomyces massasporeus TaxID=67324 RepID=UPI0033E106D9
MAFEICELPTSQVEQIELDLADQEESATTWDAIEEAPSSPARFTDSWWIWKDSNYGIVRLRSVDEVSNSEHRTFLTGLLGAAGAGLFIVIDSLFPLLANSPLAPAGVRTLPGSDSAAMSLWLQAGPSS